MAVYQDFNQKLRDKFNGQGPQSPRKRKISMAPIKKVVFDPNERPVALSYVTPVTQAFDNAITFGVLTRAADTTKNTQNFEYIGDSRIPYDDGSYQVIHHFRNIITRERIMVEAPRNATNSLIEFRMQKSA